MIFMCEPINNKETIMSHEVDWKARYDESCAQWAAKNDLVDRLSQDISLIAPMLLSFVQHAEMHYEHESIVDYAREAIDDTGIDVDKAIEIYESYGVGLDRSDFAREFEVSVTLPLYVSMCVSAINEDSAEEMVQEILDSMWISDIVNSYSVDFDSYNVSFDSVQEV